MEKELAYGTSLIRYRELREDRKTLAIEVLPDGNVQVKAPAEADEEQVLARLMHRAGWILKQQRYFAQVGQVHTPKEYVSGESFRYLGRQYRLKVEPGTPETVKRVGGQLRVTVKEKSPQRTGKMVEAWFRKQAEAKFAERLMVCIGLFAGQVSTPPPLGVRRMKSRWGSCTADGKIWLNTDLIRAPVYCIDYVITHELAHLLQHNHGPSFYRLLDQVLPDWRERKEKLEQLRWD